MKSRAAIAWESGKPLDVDTVDLEGPKAGEVLIRNVAPEFAIRTHSPFPEMIRKEFSRPFSVTRAEP